MDDLRLTIHLGVSEGHTVLFLDAPSGQVPRVGDMIDAAEGLFQVVAVVWGVSGHPERPERRREVETTVRVDCMPFP